MPKSTIEQDILYIILSGDLIINFTNEESQPL